MFLIFSALTQNCVPQVQRTVGPNIVCLCECTSLQLTMITYYNTRMHAKQPLCATGTGGEAAGGHRRALCAPLLESGGDETESGEPFTESPSSTEELSGARHL